MITGRELIVDLLIVVAVAVAVAYVTTPGFRDFIAHALGSH